VQTADDFECQQTYNLDIAFFMLLGITHSSVCFASGDSGAVLYDENHSYLFLFLYLNDFYPQMLL